jgi:ornithine cyclodeaminase/alanine dehydrogenase-like protein (mu-crystallin family)
MVRILDGTAVDHILTPALALDAMRNLFALDADQVGYGRIDLPHPQGWLRTLPGFIEPAGVFGFKTLNRSAGTGMRYTISVHDLDSGELIGVVDGLAITNARTGAVSAVGTDLLAGDVSVAALIGTGQVAAGQLAALELVRPAAEIRVFSRTPDRRQRFIAMHEGSVSARLVEASTLDEALDGALLVTLATTSHEPVLTREHLRPGMHVNSVGPASRDRREIGLDAFAAFDRIVCDSAELVLDEAGDSYDAVSGGHIRPEQVADLADVVRGTVPARSDAAETTLFKSVGTGVQDLMVAARVLAAAAAEDIGVTVDQFVSVKPFGSASH